MKFTRTREPEPVHSAFGSLPSVSCGRLRAVMHRHCGSVVHVGTFQPAAGASHRLLRAGTGAPVRTCGAGFLPSESRCVLRLKT